MAAILDNAMGWAQFRIKGGWRNAFVVSAGYAAIAGGIILIPMALATTALDKAEVRQACSGFLLGAQCLILIFLGSLSVGGAIRQDLNSKQIESHRMMPISSLSAVLGYMFGSTSRAIGMFIATVIIGTILRANQLSLETWYLANAVILFFSIMFWAMIALAAFVSRFAVWGIIGFMALILLSGFNILQISPGLMVIFSVPQVLDGMGAFGGPAWHFETFQAFTFGVQIVLAVNCILAAARKFETGNFPGLPMFFSIITYLIWVAASGFGIRFLYDIAATYPFLEGNNPEGYMVATLVVMLLVGLFVMSSAAHYAMAKEHHRRAHGDFGWHVPWALILGLGICAACVAGMVFVTTDAPRSAAAMNLLTRFGQFNIPINYGKILPITKFCGLVTASAVIFWLQIYVIMRCAYSAIRRPNLLAGGVIAVLLLVPLILDLIYYGVERSGENPNTDHFSIGSPIGCFVQACRSFDPDEKRPINLWWGVLSQVIVLGLIFALYRLLSRRRLRKARAGLFEPPPMILAAAEG